MNNMMRFFARFTTTLLVVSFLLTPLQFAFAEQSAVPSVEPQPSTSALPSATPVPAASPSSGISHGAPVPPAGGDNTPPVKTQALTSSSSVAPNKWLNSYADNLRPPEADNVSGAFVHQVAITTPAGRNGLQPNLALQYNSQDKDSENIFGAGWSMGIPLIERVNKSGNQNMYVKTDFTSTLDGELAAISATTYGAKFDDGSFRKYTFTGSAWTVLEKNGLQYKFGATDAGRVENSDATKIFRWMLEEVRDTNGNFMRYEYAKDGAHVYPSRIIYTGNGSADGPYEVSFITENRTDATVLYKHGFEIDIRLRIKEITVKFNGSLVRDYALAYASG